MEVTKKKVGFIGYGSMGSMLMGGFIAKNVLKQEDIFVSTRTKEKLTAVKARFPNVNTEEENTGVAQKTDCLFICVKPAEYPGVLNEIRPVMHKDKHVVIITAHAGISHVEKILGCRVSKIIPTVLSEVYRGITLYCHGTYVDEENMAFLDYLLGSIGSTKRVDEERMGMASELTSCAPGFFASVINEFVDSALRHAPDFTREDIEHMVATTLSGTVDFMLDKRLKPGDVIARVATKGGITEEGVKVFEQSLPAVFDELFDKTLEKRRMTAEKINAALGK